ncbi:hypothetical protein WJX74_009766 [Apatococcus lobatus]|uniref:Branched-chain amino acid aminotransferase n=1 Tax=Apatococcus lobatus TaxID=904363 RepID=A0AAW1Q5F3_9CHLO
MAFSRQLLGASTTALVKETLKAAAVCLRCGLLPYRVVEGMQRSTYGSIGQDIKSFYASELGGIVTQPELMVVPIDDHMVHRGHSVFDTALLTQGYIYQLPQHLERLADSASQAGLEVALSHSELERVVLETAAASKLLDGNIRFWATAGRGDFSLSSSSCKAAFYCVVFVDSHMSLTDDQREISGIRVRTSSVPCKPEYLAAFKSTNYLPNALSLMSAEAHGMDQAVFVTADGYVAEATNANIGIVTRDDELIVPPFDHSLRGLTADTMLQMSRQRLGTEELASLAGVQQRNFTVKEAQSAKEVFMCSSFDPVVPIIMWDDQTISDGRPGPVTLSLRSMLLKNMDPKHGTSNHIQVPYA